MSVQIFFRRLLKTILKFLNGFRLAKAIQGRKISNLMVCKKICRVIRIGYGPHLANKLVLEHTQKLLKSHEIETMIPELKDNNAAIKPLIDAMEAQEKNIQNGTNYVPIICGSLLEKAEELLENGLTCKEIIECYQLALKKSLQVLQYEYDNNSESAKKDEKRVVRDVNVKLSGQKSSKKLKYQRAKKPERAKEPQSANKDERVESSCKKSLLAKLRDFEKMKKPERIKKSLTTPVKLIMYASSVTKERYKCTISKKKITGEYDEQLSSLELEFCIMKEELHADVVVTYGKFDNAAFLIMKQNNIIGISIQNIFDLHRLCRALNTSVLKSINECYPNEPEVGSAQSVVLENQLATFTLNKEKDNILIMRECSSEDNITHYDNLKEKFVPSGGATEVEISKKLLLYAKECPKFYQAGVTKFASALEVIPRTFGKFLGLDEDDVMKLLYKVHNEGKEDFGVFPPEERFYKNSLGNLNLDLNLKVEECIVSMTARNNLEFYATKYWGLKNAVIAVSKILEVDFQ